MAHPSGGTLAGIRLRSCIVHREFESRRCFLGVSQHQKRPHFAVDDMTIYQQSTPDQPAGALEHPPGTTEANRSSAVQIELVGFAGRAKSAAGLKIWAGSAAGSRPRTASPGFGRTVPRRPPSMVKTRTATIGINRIGPYGWTFGHCHVPNSGHWDPAYAAGEVSAVIEQVRPKDITLLGGAGG